jgi:hypothetical protein
MDTDAMTNGQSRRPRLSSVSRTPPLLGGEQVKKHISWLLYNGAASFRTKEGHFLV